MAFGDRSTHDAEARINITPLVDVMLVLLVIFMVTAPVVSRTIPMDLPQPGPRPLLPPEPVNLRIAASGELFWNGSPTPLSALPAMMEAEVRRDPRHPPLLQVDASDDSDYGVVAKVLAAANNAGMERVGFVR